MLCIVTFRRARPLSGTLESLIGQTIFQAGITVEVVIVDNDEQPSAKEIYDEYVDRFQCRLSYLRETTRGIPFARNKVLDYAICKNEPPLSPAFRWGGCGRVEKANPYQQEDK